MAKLEFSGIDEICREFDLTVKQADERAMQAVANGAKVLVKALRDETKAFKEGTGELAKKIRADKPTRDAATYVSIVSAHGQYLGKRSKKKRRAGEVYYVKVYGHGNQAPDDFNDRAVRKAEPEILDAMRKTMEGRM